MDNLKKHIISFFSIALVLAVLLPTAIKLTHVFENHKHEVCDGEKSSHFHEVDIDCEFYKFHLTSFTYDFIKYPDFYELKIPSKAINSLIAKTIQLPNTNPKQLRAPPLFYLS